MTKLTPKRERFCQEVVKGSTQADAYRKAFKTKHMQEDSIHSLAYRLMKNVQIQSRLAELRSVLIEECEITQRDWLRKMQGYFYSDVRKMFDSFGNPIEIPALGENEALMIEGFEFCEEYATVKKGGGQELAVPTGYTKKIKLTSKLKAMLEFGKVMGWYEDPDKKNNNNQPQRIFIRQWIIQEEQHVHVHRGNGGASNGHDHAASSDVGTGRGAVGVCHADESGGTPLATDASAGSGAVGSNAGGNQLLTGTEHEQLNANVVERDDAAAISGTDAAAEQNWRQVVLHEQ